LHIYSGKYRTQSHKIKQSFHRSTDKRVLLGLTNNISQELIPIIMKKLYSIIGTALAALCLMQVHADTRKRGTDRHSLVASTAKTWSASVRTVKTAQPLPDGSQDNPVSASSLRQRPPRTAEPDAEPAVPSLRSIMRAEAQDLPYSNTFDTSESLDGMTIIDANHNDETWTWRKGEVRVRYDSYMAMDDWLITPPLNLEAGKMYDVSIKARQGSENYTERIELKCGSGATAADMTIQIVPPTDVTATATLKGYIAVETSGEYYVGIHAISDPDTDYLYIDDLEIVEGVSANAPAAVAGLSVTPDASGTPAATVSFNLPDKEVSGAGLTTIDKVEISCGDALLETLTDLTPGAHIERHYTGLPNGTNTFTVVAYSADCAGMPASATVFVGVHAPAVPTNVVAAETDTYGEVTLTWDASTTDIDGNPISREYVTYIVGKNTGSSWRAIAMDIAGTSYTFQAVSPGSQELVQYAVFAQTAGGTSEGCRSNMVAAGTPYTLPYAESFADASTDLVAGITRVRGYGSWYLADDKTFSDAVSQDGDNGFAYYESAAQYDEAALCSGKIAITGTAPVLSFYYQTLGEDDTNEIIVKIDAGEGPEAVKYVPQSGNVGEWRRAMVPMAAYVGKTVRLYFHAVANFNVYTFLDNISITESAARSLAVASFSAPSQVYAGTRFNLPVILLNEGSELAENYTLTLYRDGNRMAEKSVPVTPYEDCVVSFSDVVCVLDAGEHSYSAALSYDGDDNPDDNTTGQLTVNVVVPDFPTITISGEQNENSEAFISWTAPDLGEQGAIDIVEDFEDPGYEAFATTDFGMWKLYNYADTDTWPYDDSSWKFPGIGTSFGFILMDPDAAGLGALCAGYNGDPAPESGSGRCLQAFAHKQIANNAWLVSPVLSGEAQTIRFMARSLDPASYNPEQFMVLYSTGSDDPGAFIPVDFASGDPQGAPLEWTEYTASLPEGARHFAIYSYSDQRYVLSIDDISFKGYLNPFAELEIKAYNLYRDGKLLAQIPAGQTTYADSAEPSGVHAYSASVLYNMGESQLSNEVSVAMSGIVGITADTAASIRTCAGSIIVEHAAGAEITVASPDGRLIARVTDKDNVAIAVAAGIYVVRAGNTTAKVAVMQ